MERKRKERQRPGTVRVQPKAEHHIVVDHDSQPVGFLVEDVVLELAATPGRAVKDGQQLGARHRAVLLSIAPNSNHIHRPVSHALQRRKERRCL